MERRRTTRFHLRCGVQYTWVDEQGVTKAVQGISYDISAGGLFIFCEERPGAGAEVSLEIELPSRLSTQPIQLRGMGRVVRLANQGPRNGFAVAGAINWNISRSRRQFAFHTR